MATEWISRDGLGWEQSRLLRQAGLRHGATGRCGGVSQGAYESLNLSFQTGDAALHVLENRRRLCQAVGMDLTKLTTCRQTGEGHIVAVGPAEAGCGAGSVHTELAHTDALMTNCAGLPLAVFTADSAPVILFDPAHHACAVGRAGLRETTTRLPAKMVLAMELVYGSIPADLYAYVGPCAGADHVEISEGFAQAVARMGPAYACCIGRGARRTINLKQTARQLLTDAGLLPGHIDISPSCVYEEEERFFSYRRDFGRTGRMAAFAVL